jgi:hypothetical protein
VQAVNDGFDDEEYPTIYEVTWPNASRSTANTARISTIGYSYDSVANLFEFYDAPGNIVLAVPEIISCRQITEPND